MDIKKFHMQCKLIRYYYKKELGFNSCLINESGVKIKKYDDNKLIYYHLQFKDALKEAINWLKLIEN
jgi:hypothetical protein